MFLLAESSLTESGVLRSPLVVLQAIAATFLGKITVIFVFKPEMTTTQGWQVPLELEASYRAADVWPGGAEQRWPAPGDSRRADKRRGAAPARLCRL